MRQHSVGSTIRTGCLLTQFAVRIESRESYSAHTMEFSQLLYAVPHKPLPLLRTWQFSRAWIALMEDIAPSEATNILRTQSWVAFVGGCDGQKFRAEGAWRCSGAVAERGCTGGLQHPCPGIDSFAQAAGGLASERQHALALAIN